jgi:hypothetical protein
LKKDKQDIILQDLFRSKLENASVIPSASVRSKLMRKQAGREFVHFNPVRFNVYYLGAILIAGISAALMLSFGPQVSDKLSSLTTANESSKPVSSEKIINQVEQPANQKSLSRSGKAATVVTQKPVLKSRTVTIKDSEK